LSYSSDCKSEDGRKAAGAYYTPADVAEHFWRIFFANKRLKSPADAHSFIRSAKFIEPSVGAGALFFALIKALIAKGLIPSQVSELKAVLVDINPEALTFVQNRVKELGCLWGVEFSGIEFINADFLTVDFTRDDLKLVAFGNPPFVRNLARSSEWKNLFADFVSHSIKIGGEKLSLQYILPLSLSFSRDYADLRQTLRQMKASILISSYDNIPDTLFKSGKPKNNNSNTANSQRCVILSVTPSRSSRIRVTKLHRWSKSERSRFLANLPKFYDLNSYDFDNQFPRLSSKYISKYLSDTRSIPKFVNITCSTGSFALYVASVARNYIGIRESQDDSCHSFHFETQDDFLIALGVLASRVFFEYWLAVGDGFHVTRANIINFPVRMYLLEEVRSRLDEIQFIWNNRTRYEKCKLNNGKMTRSFDFSKSALFSGQI
jgi:hypothetical protein